MRGIAGIIGYEGDPNESLRQVRTMCGAMLGPDQGRIGVFSAPGVALAMRAPGPAHSPTTLALTNEDQSLRLAWDGEIYNHAELRRRLQTQGHRLYSEDEAECILHLHEELGEGAAGELAGPFAYALWDSRGHRLVLTRDRPGIRPLYYWARGSMLAFASELNALLTLPQTPRLIDRSAMADYLSFGYVPGPACIYRGIYKLPPASVLIWDREAGVRTRPYWTPLRSADSSLDEVEAIREIRRLISRSVGRQLDPGGSTGAFLSGGIDSSTVVAEMSRQMDRPVKTFCIGFAEAEFNEAPQAAHVAAALRTEHVEQVVAPDVESLFDEVLGGFDEPFADASAVPTYLAAALARDHVGVALAGDGGDELFGGYTRYHDLLERSFSLPPALRPMLRRMIVRLPHRLRGRNRLLELNREERGRYAGMVAHPLAPEEGGVARPEIVAARSSFDAVLDRWFDLLPRSDLLNQASMVDLLSYLPGDILPKIDRTTLRHGLIARIPLLDHELMEFAMSLPARLKYREGTGKWILRQAVRDLVPAEVFLHPKKGFGVPLRLWFRGPLRHRVDALLSSANLIHEFVDPRSVKRIISEHLTGRRDHSPLLWKLMVLESWLRRCRALPARGALLPAEVAVP